jgi:predicted nucleic acid-binding protein
MTMVVDASVLVAALVDSGPDGKWAEGLLSGNDLVGPHLLPVEVANILRRAELAGDISKETASMAHADLLALRIGLFPYEPFAARVWALRSNLTAYDAWYVALAATLSAKLASLDVRLQRASGPRCQFLVPERW